MDERWAPDSVLGRAWLSLGRIPSRPPTSHKRVVRGHCVPFPDHIHHLPLDGADDDDTSIDKSQFIKKKVGEKRKTETHSLLPFELINNNINFQMGFCKWPHSLYLSMSVLSVASAMVCGTGGYVVGQHHHHQQRRCGVKCEFVTWRSNNYFKNDPDDRSSQRSRKQKLHQNA